MPVRRFGGALGLALVTAGDIRIGHAAGRVSWIVLPVVPLGDR